MQNTLGSNVILRSRFFVCAGILFSSLMLFPAYASASSLLWGDENGGNPAQIEIVDGGTYAVPLNTVAPAYVNFSPDIPLPPDNPSPIVNLYRVDSSIDPLDPTYIFIASIHSLDSNLENSFAWPEPGTYELQISLPAFQSRSDHIKNFFAHLLFAEIAYAQFDGQSEMLHFTIQESAACTGNCFSNVLFLPGIEASRLYRPSVVGAPEKRIWEPGVIHDNTELFLNPDGTSKRTDIYTKDIIDEAYTANIYKKFEESMDALVAQHTISAWEPYPYDWRYDINDIVNNPTVLATTTASLIAEVEKLAATSQSGKVTLIGHSNGGLIGKLLINKLQEQGKAGLIDKFIMVAVPQLGTPKALLSLLHGEGLPDDSLPILLASADGRALGENMPAAYTLLPSIEYFARVLDPVVTFDTGIFTQPYRTKYGVAVTNQTELNDFLLGAEGRTKPTATDFYTPNILNAPLLARGQHDHDILDVWEAPAGIEVIQIAGWGVSTIEGINYLQRTSGSSTFLDHEPVLTSDGDGTVVIPSAIAATTTTYYVNLKEHNAELPFGVRRNRNHAEILEVAQLETFLNEIITNSISVLPNHITTSKPIPTAEDKPSLRLKVHSPVSLDIFDELGEHTGISTTTILGSDHVIDEEIPNSYYFEIGEGKYAGADMVGTTTVTLLGQALGSFTLDVEQVAGDIVVASTTFADIPVTASTTAVLDVQTLATSTPPQMRVDIDGDGNIDATISAGEGLSADELIGILKGLIKTLHLPSKKEAKLLKEVDKLQKAIEKEYNKNDRKKKHKTKEAFDDLLKTIKKFQKKGLLTSDEAAELLDVIQKIKSAPKWMYE